MSKVKQRYQCTACGAISSKWSGQCADCGEWNSLEESTAVVGPASTATAAATNARYGGYAGGNGITNASDVTMVEQARVSTGLSELDRVLGGGLVSGSVTLLGGDPGIGKSTLLIQSLAYLSEQRRVLYITGEESLQQVTLRARRLNLPEKNLRLLAETQVEAILGHASQEKPDVMVIDSIQTMYTELLSSAPGAVAQVRESAARLVRYAKQTGTAIFLVGHVTKEGALAGPRVLEHMVDTVLYFEGDPGSRYRVIRAVKNRFGAVNELGVFAMDESGLKAVKNPSAIFLSRHPEPVSGSVIMVTREGTRPMLVEAQALVDTSHSGSPRRVSLGLEQNRLSMLLAVMHRHAGIAMFDQDVYVNVVGGVRISETAADLPVLLAALSSFRTRPLPSDLVVFGEVGLAGEVRPVSNGEERLQESVKHGFKRAIVPYGNLPKKAIKGLQVDGIHRLHEAIDLLD
ncbi:DNA repair protein RadA [Granulosicoccus antarcticus]|uniref:DNA repair protein RadA n=1 Tax=Granulosicoccus antarcticus IMCC3135 TaxID=1192854 RepID=A0A2Z2NX97_9GAMM|nr:DNA repair protein RadA [Granulosicoccus antarcticus]ASJ76066.1 DNA repair protein RadA [Granulosicoccus antarcticus IMCC3135]